MTRFAGCCPTCAEGARDELYLLQKALAAVSLASEETPARGCDSHGHLNSEEDERLGEALNKGVNVY
jgi:hypothetical protein